MMNYRQTFYKSHWILLGIVLLLSLCTSVSAHPNTMLAYRIFFKFEGLKVTDVGENWTFDDITSQELIKKYDLDKNTPLNKKKSIEIGNKIMDDLYEDRYFTYIFVNGHDLGKIRASGFKAQITKGILSVAFNTHLPSAIDVVKKNLSVQVMDIDYTVITMIARKKPVILIGAPKGSCKVNIDERRHKGFAVPNDPYGLGLLAPQKWIGVKCKN